MKLNSKLYKHVVILCVLILKQSIAQVAITQAPWQQQVNHSMRAKLNPSTQILSLEQDIEYINNSNTTLTEIYFHVWPYAFENKRTAFGKEAINHGLKTFVHAKKSELSRVETLAFTIDGKEIAAEPHAKYGKEIVRLLLPTPLASGKSVLIKNTFIAKVPALFSRYGTQDGFYSITQWYPKPAVFDINGWHVFPYQSIGEYYSEYGKYNVTITVPDSMWVAATGNPIHSLQFNDWTKLEKGKSLDFTFEQENVHDFAWFAASNFIEEHTNATVNGTKINCTALMVKDHSTVLPSEVANSVKKGVEYYSSRVGAYPYQHCTAVIGPLEGAGGMEYPMITVCTDAEEATVVHEVGHNWFQGMLGSNERDYPWMDESINTYYQNEATATDMSSKMNDRIKFGNSGVGLPAISLIGGLHQTTGLHSHQYSNTNYGLSIYMNGPLQFKYLEEVLGTVIFDSCMKTYFALWKYKHPLPADMKDVFETISGKNMDWFFDKILNNYPTNFKVTKHNPAADGSLKLTLKTGDLPVSYRYIKNGIGYNKVSYTNEIVLDKNCTDIVLNPNGYYLESNLNDNYLANSKDALFVSNHFGLGGLGKRGIKTVFVLPNFFTFNIHDGYTPGLIFSTFNVPGRPWEISLAPSYGIKSKTLIGQAKIQRNIYTPSKTIAAIQISLVASRYSFLPIEIYSTADIERNRNQYLRFKPEVNIILHQKNHWQTSFNASFTQAKYQNNTYSLKYVGKDSFINFNYGADKLRQVASLLWKRERFSKFSPQTISAEISHGFDAYTRAIARYKHLYVIPNITKKKLNAFIEIFAMYNQAIDRSQYHANLLIGSAPMLYDAAFNDINSYRSPNRNLSLAKFGYANYTTTVPYIRFPIDISSSGNTLIGFNAQTHIIPILPIQVYFDAELGKLGGSSNKQEVWWSSGLVYSQFIGTETSFELSLPLVYSNNLKTIFNNNFNIDLGNGTIYNPWKWYNMFQLKVNLKLSSINNILREALRY